MEENVSHVAQLTAEEQYNLFLARKKEGKAIYSARYSSILHMGEFL